MRNAGIFSFIFAAVIAAARLEVFLFPQRKVVIDGTVIHHFWIGLMVLGLFLLVPKAYRWLSTALLAGGLALVVDELAYILFGNGTVPAYWSMVSVTGMVVLALLVFVLRKKIIRKFL